MTMTVGHCSDKAQRAHDYFRIQGYKQYTLIELWTRPCPTKNCPKLAIAYRRVDRMGKVEECSAATGVERKEYEYLIMIGVAVKHEGRRQADKDHKQTRAGYPGMGQWTQTVHLQGMWWYVLKIERVIEKGFKTSLNEIAGTS